MAGGRGGSVRRRFGFGRRFATRDAPRAPPATLSLRDAIPSADADGAATAIAYLQWLCETRGVLPTTEAFHLRSLIALAKWLHGSGGEGGLEKPVVMELVRVQRGSKTLAAKGARGADEAAKWLDWPDYLRLVERLRLECAPLTHLGDQRADRDVALAVQRYLLFAILACVPDRQRTLREPSSAAPSSANPKFTMASKKNAERNDVGGG